MTRGRAGERSPARRSRITRGEKQQLAEASRIETMLESVGFENVKRGTTVPVGRSTRWITPTSHGGSTGKGGRGALDRKLRGVREVQERALKRRAKKGLPPLFTLDLEVRALGPDGKRITHEVRNVVLPNARQIRRKKGETLHQAFKRVAWSVVMAEQREVVEKVWGKRTTDPRTIARKVGGLKRARAILKEIKQQRQTQVRVRVNRVVP